MNDVMSRFFVVMESEAEAYWMFCNYMEHFKGDFMEKDMLRKISKFMFIHNSIYLQRISLQGLQNLSSGDSGGSQERQKFIFSVADLAANVKQIPPFISIVSYVYIFVGVYLAVYLIVCFYVLAMG